jgi:hypothetical protein
MSGRGALVLWFVAVLVAMAVVTVWASLESDVLTGGLRVWADPWGRATIFDAYFAFVAVWLWIAWRERSTWVRIGWLAAICLLGNFAISAYFLLALRRAAATSASSARAALDALFGARPEAAS